MLINASQVFLMGYFVGELVDVECAAAQAMPTQNNLTVPPNVDMKAADLRTGGKMEIYDRISGTGPKVTGTSTIGIRYEIKTAGGVVIDNNRKSNLGNNQLVSTSFEIYM